MRLCKQCRIRCGKRAAVNVVEYMAGAFVRSTFFPATQVAGALCMFFVGRGGRCGNGNVRCGGGERGVGAVDGLMRQGQAQSGNVQRAFASVRGRRRTVAEGTPGNVVRVCGKGSLS